MKNVTCIFSLNRLAIHLKRTKQGPHVELSSVEFVLVNHFCNYHSLMNYMWKYHSYVVDGGLAVVYVALRVPTKDVVRKTLVCSLVLTIIFLSLVFSLKMGVGLKENNCLDREAEFPSLNICIFALPA